MDEAHLYPRVILKPWSSDILDADTTQISAATLLFEKVHLTGMQYPISMDEYEAEISALEPQLNSITSRFGDLTIEALIRDLGSDISLRDAVCLYYFNYLQLRMEFCDTYQPLLQANVIDGGQLGRMFFWPHAEELDHPNERLKEVVAFVAEHGDEIGRWIAEPEHHDRILEILNDPLNGAWAVAYWYFNLLVQGGEEELLRQSLGKSHVFLAATALLTLLKHSTDFTTLMSPRLYLGEGVVRLGCSVEDMLDRIIPRNTPLGVLRHERPRPVDAVQMLMSKVLTAVPVAIPKSPAAILELRTSWKEELDELRETIHLAATDILAGGGADEKFDLEVQRRFVQPLNKLRRRLAHPSREILRNLVAGAPLVAAVTIAVGPAIGLPVTAAALAGLSLDVLTAALKTRFEREKHVNDSSVAFLFRLENSQ